MNFEKFKYLGKVLEEFEIFVTGNPLSPERNVNIVYKEQYKDNNEIREIINKNIEIIDISQTSILEQIFLSDLDGKFLDIASEKIKELFKKYCYITDKELNIYFNDGNFKYEIITDEFRELFDEIEVYYDVDYNINLSRFNHKKSKIKFSKEFNFLNNFTADNIYIFLQDFNSRNLKISSRLVGKILKEKYNDKFIQLILEYPKEINIEKITILSLPSIFNLLNPDSGYNLAENELLLHDTFNNLKNFIGRFDNKLDIKVNFNSK